MKYLMSFVTSFSYCTHILFANIKSASDENTFTDTGIVVLLLPVHSSAQPVSQDILRSLGYTLFWKTILANTLDTSNGQYGGLAPGRSDM